MIKKIIECLAEEIKQYRGRIQEQNRLIDELHNKTIQSKEMELIESVDEDIVEITTITKYADGKPIQTVMQYKYKED